METIENSRPKAASVEDFSAALSALVVICSLIGRAACPNEEWRQRIADGIENQIANYPAGAPAREVFEDVIRSVAAGIRLPDGAALEPSFRH